MRKGGLWFGKTPSDARAKDSSRIQLHSRRKRERMFCRLKGKRMRLCFKFSF